MRNLQRQHQMAKDDAVMFSKYEGKNKIKQEAIIYYLENISFKQDDIRDICIQLTRKTIPQDASNRNYENSKYTVV